MARSALKRRLQSNKSGHWTTDLSARAERRISRCDDARIEGHTRIEEAARRKGGQHEDPGSGAVFKKVTLQPRSAASTEVAVVGSSSSGSPSVDLVVGGESGLRYEVRRSVVEAG